MSANCTLKPLQEVLAVLVLGGAIESEEAVCLELIGDVLNLNVWLILIVLVEEVVIVQLPVRRLRHRVWRFHLITRVFRNWRKPRNLRSGVYAVESVREQATACGPITFSASVRVLY